MESVAKFITYSRSQTPKDSRNNTHVDMLYNIEINILVYITTSWEVDLVGEHLLSPVNSASPHTLTYTSNNCCLSGM